ncbi:MAG: hypothetical protein NWP80_00470, partial [Candidatus Gracilibacteria bacterium]|nr:hypothetical protein [Candidatus Gracilibacteria bacterium]
MTNLKSTKIRLSLIFTSIVFFISLSVVILFFLGKFFNSNIIEKKEFEISTKYFYNQINTNKLYLPKFIEENINIRHIYQKNNRKDEKGPPFGFRFFNFILTDLNGNIVIQDLKQDINISIENLDLENNKIYKINDYFITKININNFFYKDIFIIKKLNYSLSKLIEDILFFTVINLIFCFIFYYFGYIFVNKNLKPVEEIIADMSNFITNSSHELKTPISVISSNLQLIKSIGNYEKDLIENSINEIKKIDELITTLGELSKIKSNIGNEKLEINSEIKKISIEFKKQIENNNIN